MSRETNEKAGVPGTVLSRTKPMNPPTNMAVLNNTVSTRSTSVFPTTEVMDVVASTSSLFILNVGPKNNACV